MKLTLKMAETKPRMFWFEDESGKQIANAFFMGSIKKQVDQAEAFGNEVVNKAEFL